MISKSSESLDDIDREDYVKREKGFSKNTKVKLKKADWTGVIDVNCFFYQNISLVSVKEDIEEMVIKYPQHYSQNLDDWKLMFSP